MEQHNIDSRFKETLGNLNRQPSADAWARLQSKMAEAEPTPIVAAEEPAEKKRTAWWLSVAAAVVLLLASVAVYRNLPVTNNKHSELAATTVKTEQPAEKVKPVITPEVVAPERTEIAMISTPKSNDPEAGNPAAEIAAALKNEAVKAQAPVPTFTKQTSQPVIARIEKTPAPSASETKTVASGNEKPEPQLAYQAPEKAVATSEPASDLAGKPIEVIVKFEKNAASENSAVAAAAPEDHAAGKSTLLNNLFKHAKNLKNGEGMNLAEIGLIQDAKVAIGNRNLPARFSKVFQN